MVRSEAGAPPGQVDDLEEIFRRVTGYHGKGGARVLFHILQTHVIERYRAAGEKVGVYPISESSWMDMGQLEELEKMRRKLESQQ